MIARLRQEMVERLSDVPLFGNVFDSRQPQLRRDMLPAVRVARRIFGPGGIGLPGCTTRKAK